MKSIYVGNLSFDVTPDQIEELFSPHGNVHSVNLINDRDSGEPRGFAFVEMDDEVADKVIELTNGIELRGRNLKVNFAKPRGVRRLRRPR
jgi:RNA recognition motif-containing protein